MLVCLVPLCFSLDSRPVEAAFLQQDYLQTTNGDVVIADMDEFADWLFEANGDKYKTKDEFRLYRVTSDESQTYDFVLDSDDYDNPAIQSFQSFIDVTPDQNPLGRDTDLLPEDADDMGDDHRDGDLSWVLVTSFNQGVVNTGKVWAVPVDRSDRDEAFVLVGGLQTPTGVCFDPNHNFVYVCDPGQEVIFQYQVDWEDDSKFVLQSDVVATIVTGVLAQDCSVDAYGALYYVDSRANAIGKVGYLDLWAGYLGQETIVYRGEDNPNTIAGPISIDVYDSETIYFVNNDNPAYMGLLNSAPVDPSDGDVEIEVREDRTPWGVAVSDDYAYFTLSDGSVSVYSGVAVQNQRYSELVPEVCRVLHCAERGLLRGWEGLCG